MAIQQQGTVTGRMQAGRYHSHIVNYGISKTAWSAWAALCQSIPRTWIGMDLATRALGRNMERHWREIREKRERHEAKVLHMSKSALKAHDRRCKMKPRLAIESLVRRKNKTYAKWRSEHNFPAIEEACVECMIRFGPLPRWEEHVQACRRRDYTTMDVCQQKQSEWRGEVREWAEKNGITRFPTQSAQFLKFYFAWWRYEYEQRDGPVTREYGRQMG